MDRSNVLVVATMEGFRWSEPVVPSPGPATDNWSVRDSICPLLGWPQGSEDWAAFIEGPSSDDVENLIDHLGLVRVDPALPHHFAWLMANLSQPGISCYRFEDVQLLHYQYEPNLAQYQGLPRQHAWHDAVLVRFLVVDPKGAE